jgi:hypothetical protein
LMQRPYLHAPSRTRDAVQELLSGTFTWQAPFAA